MQFPLEWKDWAYRLTPTLALPLPVRAYAVNDIFRKGEDSWGIDVNNAMISLGRVLAPLWGGYLYDLNKSYAFYSGAVMLGVGWLVSSLRLRDRKKN